MRLAFFSTEPTESFYAALRNKYGHVTYLPKMHQKKNTARNSLSQHGWLVLDMPKNKANTIPPLGKQHGTEVIHDGWWRLDI